MRLFVLVSILALSACQSPDPTPRVILVTVDGLRWEEVFTGMDSTLAAGDERLFEDFWAADPEDRRGLLMPFFWSTIVDQGVLLGNRHIGSDGRITNGLNFSYPSYNEILTGRADPRVDSNDKIPNPNVTVLEWLNGQPEFQGRVAAFGSWDVFPFIINEERSGIPVNAGFRGAGSGATDAEYFLDRIQAQTPSPWTTVRLDVFTHEYALAYMEREDPLVTYIAYGETDDFAHDGDFDAYIRAANRTDRFIEDLWGWIQVHPSYQDRTTLLITTDHGRGQGPNWIGHGEGERWAGSEFVWFAAVGPEVQMLGESADQDFALNQIAATLTAALGVEYSVDGTGAPISQVLRD